MSDNFTMVDLGIEFESYGVGPDNQAKIQEAIDKWIQVNCSKEIGFDLAVCGWQMLVPDDRHDLQIVAAAASVIESSTYGITEELRAKKESIEVAMRAFSLSVKDDPGIYNIRLRETNPLPNVDDSRISDDYRSQPLVLSLNSDTGRFLISYATWYNLTTIGKTVRFFGFMGDLLCRMFPGDSELRRSVCYAFGMDGPLTELSQLYLRSAK